MTSKSQCRNRGKDKNPKQNAKSLHNELPDEIALRDEIFQLKRQILLLKKANDRNLIKVRKFEDEAKKKDRQIEQLMDPVKNGDVRKLLSTKGAALLLNLKEQNNTLIQMILAKDMQIRKLLSEINTSKLYMGTKRAESYRNEIDRLKNVLNKSQNTVKETQNLQQRSSNCVGETQAQETSFSSDRSSPRDLEELHFTIHSLEMHMKYSNELLAKKNEQILQLTDQLNSYQCSTCRKNIHTKYFQEICIEPSEHNRKNSNVSERDFSTIGECIFVDPTFEITPPNVRCTPNKNVSNQENVIHESKRVLSSTPARDLQDSDHPPGTGIISPNQESRTEEYVTAENLDCGRDSLTWYDNKIHHIGNAKSNNSKTEPNRLCSGFSELHRISEKSGTSLTEDESDVDTAEFEMMEKKIENDQIEIESPVKLMPHLNDCCETGLDESTEDEKLTLIPNNQIDSHGKVLVLQQADIPPLQNCKPETSQTPNDTNGKPCEDNHCQKSNVQESEDTNSPQNVFVIDEVDSENSASIRDLYRYSPDSSFDSQISTGNAVQVEAEINHNSELEEYAKSDDEIILGKIMDENCDGDDDDDVIIG